jgi:hypothetical protein
MDWGCLWLCGCAMASGVRGGRIGWPPARNYEFQGSGCYRDGGGMGETCSSRGEGVEQGVCKERRPATSLRKEN